jgi:co-chaperonin GroES (HSP10)
MRVTSQIEPIKVSSKDFTPLGAQMLVKYEEQTCSSGGIIYSTPENTWWAEVFSVGPGCSVEVGDRVLMMQYRGENIDMSDGEFTIVEEKNALMVEEMNAVI